MQKSQISSLKEELKNCLVIGGKGFLGQHLVKALMASDCNVSVFDINQHQDSTLNIQYFKGDIQNLDDLLKACSGINTVFHVASLIFPYGFIAKACKEKLFQVNVSGTQNVIAACLKCGVEKLIYTSTNNVVFDKEIINGDETLPYATQFLDIYTETKVLAEKEVLAANGRSGLLTCALRPGGIYGPGDHVILPRLMETLKKRHFLFTIGNGKALADNVYIDNLVQAHLLAASHLTKGSSVEGQAYFISDGEPANYFNFFKPLIIQLGFTPPSKSIPYPIAYFFAFFGELSHWIFKTPKPFLTRMEAKKISLNNYFSIEKAKRDFGYTPLISQKTGIERCLPYARQLLNRFETLQRPHLGWWISVLGGMGLLGLLAFQQEAYAFFIHHVVFVPQTFLRILFCLAIVVHLIEAFYSLTISKKAKLKRTTKGWFLQTLLLGYPSLRLLLKKVNNHE